MIIRFEDCERRCAHLEDQRDHLAEALRAFLEYDAKDHEGVSMMDNDRLWDDAVKALNQLEESK